MPPPETLLLPVHESKAELLEHLRESETTIVLGETGSGKTTQIPQFLFSKQRMEKKRRDELKTVENAADTIARGL